MPTDQFEFDNVIPTQPNIRPDEPTLPVADIARIAGEMAKFEARAIVAEARLEDEKLKTAGTEDERKHFRKRMQLFENLIHEYHEALVFYSTQRNWDIVIDPEQTTSTHALRNGWERAKEAIEKGVQHSESLREHLAGSTGAMRDKLLAREHK